MENGHKTTLIFKILPYIYGILIITIGFVIWTRVEVAVLKDDLKWQQTTYINDKQRDRGDLLKLEKELKYKIEMVMSKEDDMKDMLREVLSRITVIEHELKIKK